MTENFNHARIRATKTAIDHMTCERLPKINRNTENKEIVSNLAREKACLLPKVFWKALQNPYRQIKKKQPHKTIRFSKVDFFIPLFKIEIFNQDMCNHTISIEYRPKLHTQDCFSTWGFTHSRDLSTPLLTYHGRLARRAPLMGQRQLSNKPRTP